MTHADVIQMLGGPTKVAQALACSHSQPVRWCRSGIPPRRWQSIVLMARRAGVRGVTLRALAAADPAPVLAEAV